MNDRYKMPSGRGAQNATEIEREKKQRENHRKSETVTFRRL